MIDNVLWGGAVTDASATDESTIALKELNARIREDDRVTHCMIPISDGVTIIRKKLL